ncbi:glycoside hydrolase family 79 protein [Obba rivulosa]|uniref:Glycoside hydrolase family 79 protein n=1 Tax=Obba rivulosa TaxID=1052685 RepID=A0A8E2ATI0_9APHY|nr:glycoside hydrolase family 79 protein [Obba rivulosa]
MPPVSILFAAWALAAAALNGVHAWVTVYSQQPLGAYSTSSATSTAPGTIYTGLAVYDPLVLNPPPIPSPPPATQFGITVQNNAANVVGMSIPLNGNFYGFSIEMSVVTQVLGLNASFLQVPFLNLMSQLASRVGSVHIRIGGNTQDYATIVPSLADGKAIEKQQIPSGNPTDTPTLLMTPEILYILSNVSSLVDVKWYLGIPLNDTTNLRLQIAEYGESILGNNLLGLQVGNEPDLYARHGHRPSTYGPYDYFGEFGQVALALENDHGVSVSNNLIGPSVATGDWRPEDVWDTGFISAYTNNLLALSVEHYPDDNCAALYQGFGTPKDPQAEFANFLVHSSGRNAIAYLLNSTAIAQQAGKPFIMFETNTASCGGFPGISDSFGAALWALDYGLQMAYSNISHALLHVGGQNVYYNPFTPPPTNQSTYHQWTIGPIFYSVMAVAEALGPTNTAQIIDLFASNNSDQTPGYAIYENGSLARVALFNYMTDPSGANDYVATISMADAAVPAQVQVKYLLAPSVGEHYNITWANQTFGGQFGADGRLQGTEYIQTVNCDTSSNGCQIRVPAPGFALVFLTNNALKESTPTSTATFSTTAYTKTINTASVDVSALATSNGRSGKDAQLGSTSHGSSGAGRAAGVYPSMAGLAVVLVAVTTVMKVISR